MKIGGCTRNCKVLLFWEFIQKNKKTFEEISKKVIANYLLATDDIGKAKLAKTKSGDLPKAILAFLYGCMQVSERSITFHFSQ